MKIRNIFNGMNTEKLKEEIIRIKKGCDKRIDSNGDCSYLSRNGNLILCSTCRRHLNIAKEILKYKEDG